MLVTRSFLLAPAIARLLRRERPPEGPFVEGYLAGSGDRVHLVSVGPSGCHLRFASNDKTDDEVVIPRTHAEALLDVCVGKLGFARVRVSDTPDIHVEHIISPGPLDVVTIQFANHADAASFDAPAWAGPELTKDPSCTRRSLAVNGLPDVPALALSDAGLNAFLDFLEQGWNGRTETSTAEVSEIPAEQLGGPSSCSDAGAEHTSRPSRVQKNRVRNMMQANPAHTP